ncbi:MAG: hypothetical protein U0X20_06635 [Caldilineaceae bacterium]
MSAAGSIQGPDLAARAGMRMAQEEAALLEEFDFWRNNSRPNTDFAKNQTQILRITGEIKAYLDDKRQQTEQEPDLLERQAQRNGGLLYANYVWAYFRTKFAQRRVDAFTGVLGCTDEYAWECYSPARRCAEAAGKIAGDKIKEPPLTFFDSDVTPYMRGRRSLYTPEGVGKLQTEFEGLKATLAALPVPLVSLPWLQVGHLPAAVAIAHEIGHVVEHDFELQDAYQAAIAALPLKDRGSAWAAWESEMFADVYGCLCAGPAYVLTLIDFLAGPQHEVGYEPVDLADPGDYPPRKVRIAFNLDVLAALGIDDAGAAALWQGAYGEPAPPAPDYGPLYDDATKVAAALLDTQLPVFGGQAIRAVTDLPAEDKHSTRQWRGIVVEWQGSEEERKADQQLSPAERRSQRLNRPGITGRAADLLELQDAAIYSLQEPDFFRKWMAAAALAYYSNPDAYAAKRLGSRLKARLPKAITGATRGGKPGTVVTDQVAKEMDLRATGSALAAHFGELGIGG